MKDAANNIVKTILRVAVVVLLVVGCNYTLVECNGVRDDFREKLVIDTIHDTIPDTNPIVIRDTITRTIKIPVRHDSIVHDSIYTDSITAEVVQKVYSDSNYTAYVSGVMVGEYPRLDSIEVYQRTIVKEIDRIKEVEIKPKRFSWGLQAGVGYGLISNKPDLFVGVGVQIRLGKDKKKDKDGY